MVTVQVHHQSEKAKGYMVCRCVGTPSGQECQGLHGVQVHLQSEKAKGYMVCRYTVMVRMPSKFA